MSLEGVLRIDLTLRDGRIDHVAIDSTRPVQASRIFHGKEIATVTALMPRLFSVCGTAQACAATQALAVARGELLNRRDLLAHHLLLLMETAQEHGWRLFIDGMRIAGESARMPAAAALRALLGRMQRALFPRGGWEGTDCDAGQLDPLIAELDALLARELFGVPPDEWCRRLAETHWWSHEGDLAARLLRAIEAEGLLELGSVEPLFIARGSAVPLGAILADAAADSFIAAPTFDGAARETTPLARLWTDPALGATRARFGAALATRFTALLLELARTPRRLRDALHGREDILSGASSPAAGTGVAAVEAARGLLLHRVELDGRLISRYQILAPTEWNFHAEGVVAKSLRAFPVRDGSAAKRATELIVQAIDPCVGFEVTHHA